MIMRFSATTLRDLEPVLAAELKELGAKDIEIGRRVVQFSGKPKLFYRANLFLRTALRVLVPIASFKAHTANELYAGIREVNLDEWMDTRQTFAIRSVVNSVFFPHSNFAGLKVKDAIVDHFRDKTGKRPSVHPDNPDLQFHLHISGQWVNLFADSSGESLHYRGYRARSLEAPLNEVLAAGMLSIAQYTGKEPFCDPMCGSGTLAIEAAMIARDQAPGLMRSAFGFEKWPSFDAELWGKVKGEAQERLIQPEFPIIASDRSGIASRLAKSNAGLAGLEEFIEFGTKSFSNLEKPAEEGLLMMNPPYGERLKPEDLDTLYKDVGDTMKNNWKGWRAWIISSNKDAMKRIGLRPSTKMSLMNGKLECLFRSFDLF